MDAIEYALWVAYRLNPTTDSRNKVFEFYMPWLNDCVARAHAKNKNKGDAGDLLQDGALGLIDAIESFDHERGINFKTFAAHRVFGQMVDGMRRMDWVPNEERHREKRGESEPCVMVSLEGLQESNKGFRDDWNGFRALERCDDAGSPEEFWREVCRGLTQRERIIVLLYFRMSLVLKEVGKHLGVTESRVSQLMEPIRRRIWKRDRKTDCLKGWFMEGTI